MNRLHTDIARRLAESSPAQAETEGRIPAAVALVLAPGAEDPAELELLLIKRTERSEDPWSGQMALPGGRMEEHDEDLLETAIRETLEETGVDLPRESLLGALDDLGPVTPHLPPILVRPFVFGLPDRPEVTHSEEVALHLWVPLANFAIARTTESLQIRDFQIEADGFRFGPHFVWGMTAKILRPFLHLVSAA